MLKISLLFYAASKCAKDDKACVGKSFTYIIQHSKGK